MREAYPTNSVRQAQNESDEFTPNPAPCIDLRSHHALRMVSMIGKTMTLLATACFCSSVAQAQFASSLYIDKKSHLVGEPVFVTLSITNHSGQPQVLQSSGRIPWLSFLVKTSNGSPINAFSSADFGPMRIGPGETLAKKIDLSAYFMLQRSGNFTAYAVIRSSDPGVQGSTSNNVFFEQTNGTTLWTQQVGNIGPQKSTREFRLIRFRGNSKAVLYAQIQDGRTGQLLQTYPLGEALSIRQPISTVDREQNMHVLFITTPVMWFHFVIDAEGNVVSRNIHKRTALGDPQLLTDTNGNVQVTNSIPYDPVAVAKERAKIRKITDRPEFPEGF